MTQPSVPPMDSMLVLTTAQAATSSSGLNRVFCSTRVSRRMGGPARAWSVIQAAGFSLASCSQKNCRSEE
eukprot:14009955-Heterocapsa_arctica.AAC.1